MKKFQIIVEGDADKKFFENYYHHLFHEKAPEGSITLPIKDDDTGGYKKLFNENAINPLRETAAYGVKNLVVFDADDDCEARRQELLAIKERGESAQESSCAYPDFPFLHPPETKMVIRRICLLHVFP